MGFGLEPLLVVLEPFLGLEPLLVGLNHWLVWNLLKTGGFHLR